MAIKTGQRLESGRNGPSSPAQAIHPETQGGGVPIQSSDLPRDDSQERWSSLSGLTELTWLEQYHSQRSRQLQGYLYFANVTAAQTARLALATRSIQRTLAECIKSEDKHGFINLFNAFHDALSDCSGPHPPCTAEKNGSVTRAYAPSFFDALPLTSQAPILELITKVKADASFVADRLAGLSHKDLMGLLPEKGLSKSDDSIFESFPRTNSRTSRHLGYVVDAQTELLSSRDLASPLDVLIHGVRSLAHVDLQDDDVATDVWATACSRLIAKQRPGSEKLVPAVIDSWASSSEWPGKRRLELWLLRTLQQGSFLLEQPRRQVFSARPTSIPEENVHRERFYSDSVDSLLRLLVDSEGASIIPPGALRMCEAIHAKLQHSPAHQRAFPNFAITRWLFPCFLQDAITLPEARFHDTNEEQHPVLTFVQAHGLLTDYFVPDHARQRILREVASRCYKVTFDVVYSWKVGNTPSDQATHLVRMLAETIDGSKRSLRAKSPNTSRLPDNSTILALSASDIQKMVNALYPVPALHSLNERESMYSGLRSSASSISGLSLFQAASQTDSAIPSFHETIRDPFTDTWSSDEPVCPFRDSLTTSEVLSRTEPEGEQLREICTAIDDLSSGRKGAALDHWCVLVTGAASSAFSTVYERLSKIPEAVQEDVLADQVGVVHKSYRNTIADLLESGDLLSQQDFVSEPEQLVDNLERSVVQALKRRITALEESMDFVQAQFYGRKLREIREIGRGSPGGHTLLPILHLLRVEKQRSLDNASSITEACESLFRRVRLCLDRHSPQLYRRMDTVRQLRVKMWYIADVRTSAPYESLRSVVSALKTMANPQKPPRTRLAPPSRALNASKGSFVNYHLKSETQILDLLTAPAGYGGRNKFGDDQSKALATWMENNAVENLCRGEERIHKLIMEIQRVADVSTGESSTLMASELFSSDQPYSSVGRSATGHFALRGNGGGLNLLSLCTDVPFSVDTMSSGSSHARSTTSSRDYLNSCSPSTTNRSSASVWSPVMTEARSPSSVTSVESSQTQSAALFSNKPRPGLHQVDDKPSFEGLRQHTLSLLVSDVASSLFLDGSETDRAFWTGLGGELAAKYLRSLPSDTLSHQPVTKDPLDFDFDKAFEKLTQRFSSSSNPYTKLQLLLDMDILIEPYMSATPNRHSGSSPQSLSGRDEAESSACRNLNVKIEGFRRLFCEEATRPFAIFRDLQYIAALIPSRVLETSPQGRAFWNAAIAISGLKQGICKAMVETADSIIAHHSNKRGHGRSSSTAQQERDSAAFSVPNRSPSPEDVSGRSMSDAALLLQITAKEGDAVAQRELATLYLTHPELMDHILAPLSRPRDVFQEELESKWRKNQDPTRCDPTTMCVAHHWMSLSSKGGDALAMEFLRQREEMERLP